MEKEIYILNGATGTELLKKGYRGVRQEEWILNNKEIFLELQKGYLDAGSDILYTPTFGSNRAKLKLEGLDDKVLYYNTELTRLTKSCNSLVFGNLGPSGLFLPPIGKAEFSYLYEIYKEQSICLEKNGVDALILETMMSLEDCKAAVLAAKENTKLPIFLSCTCNKKGKLLTGIDILDVLKEIEPLGIEAFGLNCSTGPKEMLMQIQRIHENTKLPLIAKPNAGLPIKRGDKVIYDCGPLEFSQYIGDFLKNGVKYIGGCCGTTKEYIREIKKIVG